MKKNIYYIFIIVIIVVGAGSFYAGMKYGKSSNTGQSNANFSMNRQQRGSRPAGISGDFLSGQVANKDNQSITIKTRDGSSRFVFYSNSTAITKPVAGSINDITNGDQVIISGSQNSDGSITAQSIQIRKSGN